MTTIIIDIKDKKIYTDKRATFSTGGDFLTTQFEDNYVKVVPYLNSFVVSVGCLTEGEKVYDLISGISGGTKLKTPTRGAKVFVVTLEGSTVQIMKYFTKGTPLWKKVFLGRYFYWSLEISKSLEGYEIAGSGSTYAEGALAAGATPKEAIIAASICDIYTNSNVDVFDLNTISNKE
jgi:hypothetical protein